MGKFFERLEHDTRIEREKLYAVPLIQDALRGEVSRQEYLAYLAQAYYHVRHTLPLLMACGSRLQGFADVQRDLAHYISEEIGHEEWILNDIRHAGGDAEAIRIGKPFLATDIMVSYAYDAVMRKNPWMFFGMVYVLEGTSVNLATSAAQTLMRSLQLGENCFSYLLSHGSLDQSHITFFQSVMDKVKNPQDQNDIVHMAQTMFVLFANVFQSIPRTAKR